MEYLKNQESGVYSKARNESLNEVILLFTGKLTPNGQDDRSAKSLSYMDRLFASADFVCMPFTPQERIASLKQPQRDQAMTDALAYAFEAGCRMLYATGSSIGDGVIDHFLPDHFVLDKEHGEYIIDLHHIRIAFVRRVGLTKEHAARLRQSGVDIIIVLLSRFKSKVREQALALANAGADLIVMTSGEIKANHIVTTDDGREVPYIGGLGSLFSGERDALSAAVKVRLLRSMNGEVSMDLQYVPVQQRPDFKGFASVALPAQKAYSHGFVDQKMRAARREVAEQIGRAVRRDPTLVTIRNKSGFKPQLSINEICAVLGINAAQYHGAYPADAKVHSIVIRKPELDKDCVVVIQNGKNKVKKSITAEEAIAAQAVLAIAGEPVEGLPCIVVEDPIEAYIKLVTYIREQYHPLTIGITGTIGKSTTTDMIKCVMKYGYKTLDVRGNYNTFRGIGLCIQKLDDTYDAYVQEVHGGQTGAASVNSKILQPDMCVVTYVGAAHLSQVKGGTVLDVLREKLGITDGLKEGGTLFINNDNEYLQGATPAVHTVRYAANNKDSDYYAEDIIDYGDQITFTIVCDEGRYDALLNCGGTYNVANAVCAFAVGRKANIPPEKILAGLARYRTEGYRQNVVRMNGCVMRFDCDSTTPDSMISALKSFAETRSRNPGRFIAILGDTAMLGKENERWHRQYGQLLGELGYDAVLSLGPGSLLTCEEAQKAGIEAHGYIDREEFEEAIRGFIKPGDNIIFKSSPKGGADLIPTVEHLFGKIR